MTIENHLNILQENLNKLDSSLAILQTRLTAILLPEETEEELAENVLNKTKSSISDFLSCLTIQVHNIDEKVKYIIPRLDLDIVDEKSE